MTALCMIVAYLAPSIIARVRGIRHAGSLVVFNVFFGWTIFGWIACLAWACSDR
jgi:hypothetical protein